MPKNINSDLKIAIGKNLEILRTNNNLTVSESAHELGVTRETVISWESGKTSPNLKFLIKICKFYNVSSDWILKKDSET